MHLDVNFSSHFLTVPVYCRALLRAAKTQAILHWEKEIQEHALRQPEASHKLSQATRATKSAHPPSAHRGSVTPNPICYPNSEAIPSSWNVYREGETTSTTQLTSHPGALRLLQSAPPTPVCFPQQSKTADSEGRDPSGKQTLLEEIVQKPPTAGGRAALPRWTNSLQISTPIHWYKTTMKISKAIYFPVPRAPPLAWDQEGDNLF